MAKFKQGISGNPQGKKVGTLNKRTELAKQFDVHAEALINKTVELALSGDTVALRLCVERLVPKVTDKPSTVVMPDLTALSYCQKWCMTLGGLPVCFFNNLYSILKFNVINNKG